MNKPGIFFAVWGVRSRKNIHDQWNGDPDLKQALLTEALDLLMDISLK